MEPEAPVAFRTRDDGVGHTIARPRAISALVSVFALMGLVLAAVGVYGVMAYSVKERTQEIGVRIALGASSTAVYRTVLLTSPRGAVCVWLRSTRSEQAGTPPELR